MHKAHSSSLITKLSRSRAAAAIAVIAIATAAVLAVGCESSSQTTSGPSPVKCQVSLATSSTPLEAGGGVGNVAVTTQPECPWDASADPNWISEISPTNGQGSAEVTFRVATNPLPSTRQGDIIINGGRVRVLQAASPCRFEIVPRSQGMAATDGLGTIAVTAANGCSWTATSQASWLSLTPPSSGDGSGTLSFSVTPNSGGERSATVSIADQTLTVTQEGAPRATCTYAIAPTNQSVAAAGGAGTPVMVSTTNNCTWATTSNASWLTITSGSNGSGNGTVGFTVAANRGSARTGTLAIAGQTFTVSQAAEASCAYSIEPTSQSIAALGGPGTQVSVSTSGGCTWTSSSGASWLTITSGESGTGNAKVGFNVAANIGAERIGTLTIAGQIFTVTQQALLPCVYTIKPTSKDIGKDGSKGVDIDVTTTPNCTWAASSNVNWITVISGASGTGTGTVRFTVAKNDGDKRDGTLTVAGQTFTVHQKD